MPIEVVDVWKRYGPIVALRGVSLTVEPGRVVGFVGPNAAGKTTLIKSIVGLVIPQKGDILVDGFKAGTKEAKRLLAYSPELPDAPPRETVCGLLETLGRIEGLSREEARRAAREAAGVLGLEEYCRRRIGSLSKGTRKRVVIAQALIPRGKRYYLLDEPFTGLDPEWIKTVRDVIVDLRREGAGLLVSSHILKELEEIVDEVVIVYGGRSLFRGSIEELSEQVKAKPTLTIRTPDIRRAEEIVKSMGLEYRLTSSTSINITLVDAGEAEGIVSRLRSEGVRVTAYSVKAGSLEDAYLTLLRRSRGRTG